MATDHKATRDQIIAAALRKVSSHDPGNDIEPEELVDAVFALNTMLKAWQVDVDLWKRETFTLWLNTGQRDYTSASWKATFGARFTREKKEREGTQSSSPDPIFPIDAPGRAITPVLHE